MREGVRPYVGMLVLAGLCMAVTAGTTALYPLLIQRVIDDVFVNKNYGILWPLAGAVLATFLIKAVSAYGETVFSTIVGQRVVADLQNRLFRHVVSLDVAFFHEMKAGGILSRLTNDINMIRYTVSTGITSLCKDSLEAIFLIGGMFWADWRMASFSLIVLPLVGFPLRRLGRRIRKVSVKVQEQQSRLTVYLTQAIQGIRVVKAYGMEQYEVQKVFDLVKTLRSLIIKGARIRAASSPLVELLAGAAVTIVIIYGGSQVIAGETTSGRFIAFIAALMLVYRPMKNLANLNANLQDGLGSATRFFTVIDTPSRIPDNPGAPDLVIKKGAIQLLDVHFSYTAERSALNGVDLEIPGGKTIALVGASGSGKTTLLNLLPRFYDVTQGRLLVDGQDVREVNIASLRAHMALVSQEITLFDDTVRANIAYGRFGASDEDIERAARNAAAHDFIVQLPQGYDTMVGERGFNLSGGQRQRLAVARAMLKDAPILLLDEATSALDTESERQVQEALERLMAGRTTLVVAHRLSTIMNADIIHVLDRGRVVESGRHAELVAQGGIYAKLHAMQDENGLGIL